MPEITNDTPRVQRTCQGAILSFPIVYTAGHTLEDNEAAQLSQVFIENLRNNFAPKVVKYYEDLSIWDEEANAGRGGMTRQLTEAELSELQREFDKFCDGYEFGARTGGRGPVDPVYYQACLIAEERVRKALKGQGHNLSAIGREKIRELAEQAVESNPKFLEAAKVIVEARKAATAADDLSVSL